MAGVEETTRRLTANGSVEVEAWLEPWTIAFETRDEGLYQRAGTAVDRLVDLAIEYVRLNVIARKS
jgi:hypothetical protein